MNIVENETDQENENVSRLRSVANIAVSVVTLVLVGFVAYIMICSARGKAVEVFGRSVLKVVTGSMEPSLQVGDYIIVKSAGQNELAEGDIISFYSEESDIHGKIVTHRIKEVLPDGTYITQGDSNPVQDSKAVRYDQIVGKYSKKARFFRWVGSFGDKRKLLLMLVIIPMTLIALYEVRTISKLGIQLKKENDAEAAQERERLIREAIDREKERLAREGLGEPLENGSAGPTGSDEVQQKTDELSEEESTADVTAEEDLPEKEVETVESGKDNEKENDQGDSSASDHVHSSPGVRGTLS